MLRTLFLRTPDDCLVDWLVRLFMTKNQCRVISRHRINHRIEAHVSEEDGCRNQNVNMATSDGIIHVEENTKVFLEDSEYGIGSLHITEK